MKRTALSIAVLLTTTALAALLAPTALAELREPVVWEGIAEYSLDSNGKLQVTQVSDGCSVSPTFNARVSDAQFSPADSPSSSRGSASCIPRLDPHLTEGKVPTCTATFIGTVSGGPGIIVGYAYCRPVYTYCVGTNFVPCFAQAAATPSDQGGCGAWLAVGINAAVRVRCIVTVVWT